MDIVIGSEFHRKVIPLINASKTSIDIVIFDWRWYPADVGNPVSLFNQSLVRAVRRGVAVRAVVNNDRLSTLLQSVGIFTKRFRSARILHPKLMYIDDEILITGSHNYTQSAFTANMELSIIWQGVGGVPRVKEFFNNLFNI